MDLQWAHVTSIGLHSLFQDINNLETGDLSEIGREGLR